MRDARSSSGSVFAEYHGDGVRANTFDFSLTDLIKMCNVSFFFFWQIARHIVFEFISWLCIGVLASAPLHTQDTKFGLGALV